MKFPSPSKHDRAAICPASEAYPQVEYVGTEFWSSRGTVLHAFLCDVRNLGVEAALARVPAEFRADCEVVDLSVLPACEPDKYAAEVTFAYNVDTGECRELGRGLKRSAIAAMLGPREMAGTEDVIGLTSLEVFVGDYKTGYHRYGPAGTLRQLRAYALFAARAYGKLRAKVAIIRIREDGTSYFDHAEFDEFEIASIELEIRAMVAKVEEARAAFARGERLAPVEGDHCRHCPAFDSCPAKVSLLRAASHDIPSVEDWIRGQVETATPEQLGAAVEKVYALEKVVERAKAILRQRAEREDIPLASGRVYGAVKEEEIGKPEIAREVLEVLYGPETAAAAFEVPEPSISKASIERALRAHVLKPGLRITHLVRETVETLRAAGAISLSYVVRAHKPKAPIQAPLSAGQEGASP